MIEIALIATLTRTADTTHPKAPRQAPDPPGRSTSLPPIKEQALILARDAGWTLHQSPATGRWHATRGRAATRTYGNQYEAALAALARAKAPT